MNGTSDIELILIRIKNCYRNIQLLTLDCLSENSPEHITQLLRNREEILHIIVSEEERIAHRTLSDASLSSLRKDIESIVASIRIADQQLRTHIKGYLDNISSEMTKQYKKSRAVSAYAEHSRG